MSRGPPFPNRLISNLGGDGGVGSRWPQGETAASLTDSERRTLALLCDTFVPSLKVDGPCSEFYRRPATAFGIDVTLAAMIEEKLSPYSRDQIHRLLRVLESSGYGLLLNGSPSTFSRMDDHHRERLLKGWRDSGLSTKRAGFQGIKKLILLLSYAATDTTGSNPNWEAIGYPGPQERGLMAHPVELRISPLVPEGDTTLESDVLVIGSGAGGSVIAHELSRSGLNVLVVEAGGYETADSFRQSELGGMDRLFMQHGLATTKDFALILLAGRGGGGGTLVNWMTCMRPPPYVLQEWEKEYGVDGLGSPTFEGYVEEVWNTLKVNANESQRNISNEALWKGCSALGYHEGTDYEVIQRDAAGCGERCAFCTYGCVYTCKQSTIVNYLPMASHYGARFLFDTSVDNVTVEKGKATGAQATWSRDGKKFRVSIKAKAVVVACGAVNTPALLLKSGIRGKNIGRNLRVHPTTAVVGQFPDLTGPWSGPPQTVAVRKFIDLDGTRHGFWVEAAPAHPGLFALSTPWIDGRSHKEIMATKYAHSATEIVLVREWGSGNVEVDKYGSPSVTYDLDQRDKQNMTRGIQETARILAAAGASEIWSAHSDPAVAKAADGKMSEADLETFSMEVGKKGVRYNDLFLGSAHLMGSCRMGAESVGAVSPQGELYGVENLFVGDGSVFPTAPGVNPMITIMAMARRTAESVKTKLRSN